MSLQKGKIEKKTVKLSPNCRCTCSTVCLIEGPAEIKAGSQRKTYALELTTARNLGCRASTSDCKHDSTEWTAANRNVTLSDKAKKSVKVKVAAGAPAGTFVLKAKPKTNCKCKGPGNIVKDCTVTSDSATITIKP